MTPRKTGLILNFDSGFPGIPPVCKILARAPGSYTFDFICAFRRPYGLVSVRGYPRGQFGQFLWLPRGRYIQPVQAVDRLVGSLNLLLDGQQGMDSAGNKGEPNHKAISAKGPSAISRPS